MSAPERPALVVELAGRLARAEAERDKLRAAVERYLREIVGPLATLTLAMDGIDGEQPS